MNIKYCLNDYYNYAEEVWDEMMIDRSYYSSDKKLFCTQIAYHHWFNQDDLEELTQKIKENNNETKM